MFTSFPVLIPDVFSSTTQPEPTNKDEEQLQMPPLPDYMVYTPRLFGFKVSELAKTGPRMGWLRWKDGLVVPGPGVGSTSSGVDGNVGQSGDIFEGLNDED
jgi:casein kinase II subunit beta